MANLLWKLWIQREYCGEGKKEASRQQFMLYLLSCMKLKRIQREREGGGKGSGGWVELRRRQEKGREGRGGERRYPHHSPELNSSKFLWFDMDSLMVSGKQVHTLIRKTMTSVCLKTTPHLPPWRLSWLREGPYLVADRLDRDFVRIWPSQRCAAQERVVYGFVSFSYFFFSNPSEWL